MASGALGVDGVEVDGCNNVNASDSDSETSDLGHGDSGLSVGDHEDYPAMVWDKEHAGERGISSLDAALSLTTAIVGAGVMALPQLPSKAGLWPCIICMILGAWITYECGSAFHKANYAWNKTHQGSRQLKTFEDFGEVAAGGGGAILVRTSVLAWFVGVCAGFLILMAQQLQRISGLDWNYRIFVLILIPILWFACMLRDLTALSKLVPIGVLGAIGSCFLIMLKAFQDVEVWHHWPKEEVEQLHSKWPRDGFMALGSCLATFFGAFGVMGNIPVVASEMRHPEKFPRALRMSLALVTFLYAGVTTIGYWGYGNFIQSNILNSMGQSPANFTQVSMPYDQWTGRTTVIIPEMTACCVLVNLLLSYPLCMMSVFVSIQSLESAQETMAPGTCGNYLMRTGFVALTVGIALALEDFPLVFGLFASVNMPIQSVFVPILFGTRIRKQIGAKLPGPCRRIVHAFMMVVALFCLVVGTTNAVKGIVEHFSG